MPEPSDDLDTLGNLEHTLGSDELINLLAAAVRHSRTACCITASDLEPPGPTIVYANPAYCTMVGRPLHEVIGRSPRMMQGPLSDRRELDRLRATLSAGQPFRGETVNYRKDGQAFIISWDVIPVRDTAGDIRWFVASQEDVTRHHQAEALIAAEQAVAAEAALLVSSGALTFEAAQRWCASVRTEARRLAPGADVGVLLRLPGTGGVHEIRDGHISIPRDRLDTLLAHGDTAAVHTDDGPVFLAAIPAGGGKVGAVAWHSMGADAFALLHQPYAATFAQFAGATFDQMFTAVAATTRDDNDTVNHSDPHATAWRAYNARRSLLLRNVLVEAHLPIAERLARKFHDVDDALTVASLELIRCVERFDPDRGVPFAAFAVSAIQAALLHTRESARWPVHVPRQTRRDLGRVIRTETELAPLLGRTPDDREIADAAHMPLAQVQAARLLSETLRTAELDTDPAAGDDVAAEALLRLAVARLNDEERRLAELRFDDGLSQREIAELLNISQAKVSRLLHRITEKILATLAATDRP